MADSVHYLSNIFSLEKNRVSLEETYLFFSPLTDSGQTTRRATLVKGSSKEQESTLLGKRATATLGS
jgi:hypothetical protein